MKIIITKSANDQINKFDSQLFDLLKEDVKQFRQAKQSNLISFVTKRYDYELQMMLKAEIERHRNRKIIKLAYVG